MSEHGNNAAMREALDEIARWDDGIGADISNIARAALAAPARNCDRAKDAAENLFKERFGRPWTREEDELATFLFAPAQEGAEG